MLFFQMTIHSSSIAGKLTGIAYCKQRTITKDFPQKTVSPVFSDMLGGFL
jgi:hypothetical protein